MQPLANFRKYGAIDVSELRACVEHQPESAWREQDYRQEAFQVHRHTETIYLLFDKDFRHFEPTRQPKYEEFQSALKPVIQLVSGYFDYQGWAVRCILTKLAAGGAITPHRDFGFSLAQSHRFHLPIITNPSVDFTVGDETVQMSPGELWEINNTRRHSVINRGAEYRVHMILDWAEPVSHAQLRIYQNDRQRHRARTREGAAPRYD